MQFYRIGAPPEREASHGMWDRPPGLSLQYVEEDRPGGLSYQVNRADNCITRGLFWLYWLVAMPVLSIGA